MGPLFLRVEMVLRAAPPKVWFYKLDPNQSN